MSVSHIDSIGKIQSYLKNARSSKFSLSKLFFRDYTCPAGCGGCCQKFTLDYFEGERWEKFKKTYPEQVSRFKVRKVSNATVYTDFQADNNSRWCRHLDLSDGRCKVHAANPFSCEFELIKFIGSKDRAILIKKLYGRGWNLTRIDGKKGALCEMISFNPSKIKRDIELLKELVDMSIKLEIKTKLPKVIHFLERHLPQLLQGKIPTKNIDL